MMKPTPLGGFSSLKISRRRRRCVVVVDLARDADAVEAGHQHEVAAGDADVGAERRPLGADAFLDDLDEDFLAALEDVLDERLGPAHAGPAAAAAADRRRGVRRAGRRRGRRRVRGRDRRRGRRDRPPRSRPRPPRSPPGRRPAGSRDGLRSSLKLVVRSPAGVPRLGLPARSVFARIVRLRIGFVFLDDGLRPSRPARRRWRAPSARTAIRSVRRRAGVRFDELLRPRTVDLCSGSTSAAGSDVRLRLRSRRGGRRREAQVVVAAVVLGVAGAVEPGRRLVLVGAAFARVHRPRLRARRRRGFRSSGVVRRRAARLRRPRRRLRPRRGAASSLRLAVVGSSSAIVACGGVASAASSRRRPAAARRAAPRRRRFGAAAGSFGRR